jgi:hypothetical protein
MPRSQRQGRYRSRNTDAVTRKRSLVQIQYGPRDFSKSCLALRVMMGARLLRFCPISPGHGAGILASTQGVPAVPVSSKPMVTDAIECGNHAASRMSRTVNAVRHAHIADSVLEVCLGAIPVHGVHIGDSGAKPLPARKGLTGLRLCVTGGIQSLRRPRYVRAPRTSGPRGAQTGRARPGTAGGRSGPRPAASW